MAHARPPAGPPARRRYVVLGVVLVLVIVLLAGVGYAVRPSGRTRPSAGPAVTDAGPEVEASTRAPVSPDSVGVGRNSISPSPTPETSTPSPSTAAPTPSTSGRVPPRTTPPQRRPGSSAWTAGVSYRPGDRVSHRGAQYVCRQAHTAQADWQPQDTPTLWRSA
ncbi:carbohydrate-binding protein [Actinomadura sp. 9N215]|uniref:carbohydrate-binding protein n=1 Tax=Actinomadura sp. 9N215 TaxID=3375150 RepID=UPI0037A37646